MQHIIDATERFVRGELEGESSGHDWWHVVRVRNLAERIAIAEGADVSVVVLTALLHDIADYKFTADDESGPRVASEWLTGQGADAAVVENVADTIRHMSFKGAGVVEAELSLEGRCVRDADRLDAVGAIGIARTFAYGGHVGRPMHDPGTTAQHHNSCEQYRSNTGTTVNHFYEKLLLLKDRMSTPAGRRIAEHRHAVMEDFLDDFYAEWEGRDGSPPACPTH